jgi:hypothetical protein
MHFQGLHDNWEMDVDELDIFLESNFIVIDHDHASLPLKKPEYRVTGIPAHYKTVLIICFTRSQIIWLQDVSPSWKKSTPRSM